MVEGGQQIVPAKSANSRPRQDAGWHCDGDHDKGNAVRMRGALQENRTALHMTARGIQNSFRTVIGATIRGGKAETSSIKTYQSRQVAGDNSMALS